MHQAKVLHTIRRALPLDNYAVLLVFEDGLRVADLSTVVGRGVFAHLRDPKEFAKMYVDEELGTITWPGELDLDADVLYQTSVALSVDPFVKEAARKVGQL